MGVWAFVIGLSQISFFFSWLLGTLLSTSSDTHQVEIQKEDFFKASIVNSIGNTRKTLSEAGEILHNKRVYRIVCFYWHVFPENSQLNAKIYFL